MDLDDDLVSALGESDDLDPASSPERVTLDERYYRVAASGRYATRRAGPVEHVPLPSTGSVNTHLAPFPSASRAISPGANAIGSSKPGPSKAGARSRPAATVIAQKHSQPKKKKRRSSHSSFSRFQEDSPTVQFLKNPFPSPVSIGSDSPEIPLVALPYSETYGQYRSPALSDRRRKHARVWFQRREHQNAPSTAAANEALQAITGSHASSFGSPAGRVASLPLMSRSTSTRSLNGAFTYSGQRKEDEHRFEKIQHSVIGGPHKSGVAGLGSVLPSRAVWDAAALHGEDEFDLHAAMGALSEDGSYLSEEVESDNDENERAAIKKQQAAGFSITGGGARGRIGGGGTGVNAPGAAALRTTIACSELKAAFLANPHPAAPVLDALAQRLGLGKSESNMFGFCKIRQKLMRLTACLFLSRAGLQLFRQGEKEGWIHH